MRDQGVQFLGLNVKERRAARAGVRRQQRHRVPVALRPARGGGAGLPGLPGQRRPVHDRAGPASTGSPPCTPPGSRRRTCAPSSTGCSRRADVGETFSGLVTDGPLLVAAAVAALVGLISFASPCVLPLVPGYLSYVAGLAGTGAADAGTAAAGGGTGRPPRPPLADRRTGRRQMVLGARAVRARLHRGLRRARHGGGRSRPAAAGARRRHHPRHGRRRDRRRPGLPRLAAPAAAHQAAVAAARHGPGRGAAAGRRLRAGLDAVPGPDARRRPQPRLRRGHRRPRRLPLRRLLPGPRRALRARGPRRALGVGRHRPSCAGTPAR